MRERTHRHTETDKHTHTHTQRETDRHIDVTENKICFIPSSR